MGGSSVITAENAAGRYYVEALDAPVEWWKGLGEITQFVRVLAGGKEVF